MQHSSASSVPHKKYINASRQGAQTLGSKSSIGRGGTNSNNTNGATATSTGLAHTSLLMLQSEAEAQLQQLQ